MAWWDDASYIAYQCGDSDDPYQASSYIGQSEDDYVRLVVAPSAPNTFAPPPFDGDVEIPF